MNPRPTLQLSRTASRARISAFTLTEILTATAIFGLVTVGVVYTHLFGLKMATLTNSELTTTHDAREALNRVRDEIRSGKILNVGNGDEVTFTPIPVNNPQVGNALQIYPTNGANNYVLYYLDGEDHSLKRRVSGSDQIEVIALCVTNQMVFSAEDQLGNVLTNDRNNRVISMTLEFSQEEFPVARVSGGGYFDSYRLQTRIARRAIE